MLTRQEMIDALIRYKKEQEMTLFSEEEVRKDLEKLTDEILQEMIDGLRPLP